MLYIYIYIYIYIYHSYLKLLLYIERYNHLHRLNPFTKGPPDFSKIAVMGRWKILLKMGGGPGMGGLVL